VPTFLLGERIQLLFSLARQCLLSSSSAYSIEIDKKSARIEICPTNITRDLSNTAKRELLKLIEHDIRNMRKLLFHLWEIQKTRAKSGSCP
jgi:hypothetical protein